MKKQKKVLISTFNNSKNNYGAVFQSCALSKFIETMGHSVCFLTLKQRAKTSAPKKSLKLVVKQLVYNIITLPTKKGKHRRTKGFYNFTKRTQKQVVFDDYDQVKNNPPIADVYLSGSDQVWNPKTIHEELFCSFVSKEQILISYAASMGTEVIPKQNESIFRSYIARYKSISVREDTMINIIKQYTELPVSQNIDPVFLMSKQQWSELSKPYKKLKFRKYIFAYIIEWDKAYQEKILKLKEETNLPIVLVSLGGLRKSFANQMVFDASPEEFLFLLLNSEIVVSSSFHGTALSILFNKPFLSILGKDKPTRIQSLLRHFNLIDNGDFDKFSLTTAYYDFDRVNTIIDEDRRLALEYLTKCFAL